MPNFNNSYIVRVLYMLAFSVLICPISAFGQDTLMLKAIQSANIFSYDPSLIDGDNEDMIAKIWTHSSDTIEVKSLFEFDLSTISNGSIVEEATLSLFHNPATDQPADNIDPKGHYGLNRAWLSRIIAPWSSSLVNWNSQPPVSVVNRLDLPFSVSPDEDYTELDVTDMVQQMVLDGGFGFQLEMQSKNPFRAMIFASANHADELIRPELRVVYTSTSTGLNIKESTVFQGSVFPNPFRDHFYISGELPTTESLEIELIDLTGKVVFSQVIKHLPNTVLQEEIRPQISDEGFLILLLKQSGHAIWQQAVISAL